MTKLLRLPARMAIVVLLSLVSASWAAAPDDLAPLLQRIKAVGREGTGNTAAAQAWHDLSRRESAALPTILKSFAGADPISSNWLRAAVDTIAERTLSAGKSLPVKELEDYVCDRANDPASRRVAYEWLVRADPKTPDRLLPGMLNDPNGELRRDAVARVITEAETKLAQKDQTAVETFRTAFAAARDKDQVDLIAKQLRKHGVPVDIAAHFGFLQTWVLVGPFDNAASKGFGTVYPPEQTVDLTQTYSGKDQQSLQWKTHMTADTYGLVDLNKAIGKHHNAVAYAYAVVAVPVAQAVELRGGCNNAIKIFLNGKEICFRDEYHHGTRMDHHIARCRLQAGRNEVLVKVCQNDQSEDWAQSWSFQLRICDAIGGAVPVTFVTPPLEPAKESK